MVEVNLTGKFTITSTFKQKYCCFRLKFLSDFLFSNLSKSTQSQKKSNHRFLKYCDEKIGYTSMSRTTQV